MYYVENKLNIWFLQYFKYDVYTIFLAFCSSDINCSSHSNCCNIYINAYNICKIKFHRFQAFCTLQNNCAWKILMLFLKLYPNSIFVHLLLLLSVSRITFSLKYQQILNPDVAAAWHTFIKPKPSYRLQLCSFSGISLFHNMMLRTPPIWSASRKK